ncbi:MAG: class II aldolase/adducin family protein [Burkholderiaceae bacterium]
MSSIQTHVSADEWSARVEVAACYRLVHHYGMTDMVYNHISGRVPGTEHLLINAYGYLYDEIRASNLIKIDLDGNIVGPHEDPHGYGLNQAGIVIHTAVHKARENVGCVIHTHTRAGMAVSAQAQGLLPLTQTAMRFYGHLGYHDYEGPALDVAEQARLVADLGEHSAMILRNHGLLAAGPSVAEAFNTLYWLEMACKAQIDALAGGGGLHTPPEEVRRKTALMYQPRTRGPFGLREWPAMLRLLDRIDPSYRE